MPDSEARKNLVPVTFKLDLVDAKQMEVICAERRHKTISETYRDAVQMYLGSYHRGKAVAE